MGVGINAMMFVIKHINLGYDDLYINDALQLSKGTSEIIRGIREIDYKSEVKEGRDNWITSIISLYNEGFTFDELSYITNYSKEGIRNRIIAEIKQGKTDIDYHKRMNKEGRKSLNNNVFYMMYVKDLDENNKTLVEVIKESPYSESTFLNKMRDIR